MNSSITFTIFLVCFFSFNYSFAFKLQGQDVQPNLEVGKYYIQNVESGLVVGAMSNGVTLESLDEAKGNPEREAYLQWKLSVPDFSLSAIVDFQTSGPYVDNNLSKERVCMYGTCAMAYRSWYIFPRGNGTWGIRFRLMWGYWPEKTCLTSHGLNQKLTFDVEDCDIKDTRQTWRLIKVQE